MVVYTFSYWTHFVQIWVPHLRHSRPVPTRVTKPTVLWCDVDIMCKVTAVVTLSASKGTVSLASATALRLAILSSCALETVQVGGSGGTGGTSCRCPGSLAWAWGGTPSRPPSLSTTPSSTGCGSTTRCRPAARGRTSFSLIQVLHLVTLYRAVEIQGNLFLPGASL